MKKFSKEIQIALVAIVGILVLYFGLQFLKGMTLFSSDNRYYVKFQDVSGLSVASPIFANGYRVGVVEGIDFDYSNTGEIVASIGVNKDMQVPKGSRAEIATDLMGNVKVQLVLGNLADGTVAPGDTVTMKYDEEQKQIVWDIDTPDDPDAPAEEKAIAPEPAPVEEKVPVEESAPAEAPEPEAEAPAEEKE